MHLEGPWLSSISLKKRAEKITKSQREELERNWRDRNKRLREMGLPKQSFEEFLDFVHGRKKTTKTESRLATEASRKKKVPHKETSHSCTPDLSYRIQRVVSKAPISDSENGETNSDKSTYKVPLEIRRPDIWVTGPTSSKPSPTYTGEKVVGIGTMHKSNMVPIFSDEEAQDISKMRR